MYEVNLATLKMETCTACIGLGGNSDGGELQYRWYGGIGRTRAVVFKQL